MDFSATKTPTLLATWNNLKKGLDKVDQSVKDGSFHTVKTKGGAPPSQAGQTTLWFALAVSAELTARGIRH